MMIWFRVTLFDEHGKVSHQSQWRYGSSDELVIVIRHYYNFTLEVRNRNPNGPSGY